MNTKAATTSRLPPPNQANSTASSVLVHTPVGIAKKEEKTKQNIESAVFAYIQAMRALGRTKLNTGDIASALGCKPSDVEQTLGSLRQKGVKKVK